MSHPIVHVATDDPAETDDLLEALSVRGLAARRAGPAEVEVTVPRDEGYWNLQIVSALEAWLEQTDHDAVVARVGTHSFTVKAPDRRVPIEAVDDERRSRIGTVAIVAGAIVLLVVAAVLFATARLF